MSRGAFTTPQGDTIQWRVVPVATLATVCDETMVDAERKTRSRQYLRRYAVAVHPDGARVLLAMPGTHRARLPAALRNDTRFRNGWTADWAEILAAHSWVETRAAQSEARHALIDASLGQEFTPQDDRPDGDPTMRPPPDEVP